MALGHQSAHAKNIKELWPDKLLYGVIMVFMTGIIGFLHAAFVQLFAVTYSDAVWSVFRTWPAAATLGFSLGAIVCGLVALRQLHIGWAYAGAACGVASFALFGLGSLFSVIAAGFLVLAQREGEHASPATARLIPEDWPDKSLAASLLLFMAGVVSIAWGGAILSDMVQYGPQATLFAWGGIASGVISIGAAIALYHQRGAALGVVAALISIVVAGGYVIGPLLAIGSLAMLWSAWREDEFEADRPAATGKPASR